jgi:hypothetical protein
MWKRSNSMLILSRKTELKRLFKMEIRFLILFTIIFNQLTPGQVEMNNNGGFYALLIKTLA